MGTINRFKYINKIFTKILEFLAKPFLYMYESRMSLLREIGYLRERDLDKKLNKEEEKELKLLLDDVIYEAKKVRLDYKDNPSEMSGSVVQVHENSPYLTTKENRLIKINKKVLDKLKQMTDEAIKVREDYKKNSTELSGSVTQVHANSPILKEDKDAD